jgi:MFS family permease
MAEMSASAILGLKLDSIPFSAFHVAVILLLVLVGFIDGYDLALTGSLLVLAKGPLHITPDQIRWLTIAATLFVVVGGFIASAISDHVSRKVIIQIGVVGITVRLEAAGFLVVVAIRRAFGLFPFRQYLSHMARMITSSAGSPL